MDAIVHAGQLASAKLSAGKLIARQGQESQQYANVDQGVCCEDKSASVRFKEQFQILKQTGSNAVESLSETDAVIKDSTKKQAADCKDSELLALPQFAYPLVLEQRPSDTAVQLEQSVPRSTINTAQVAFQASASQMQFLVDNAAAVLSDALSQNTMRKLAPASTQDVGTIGSSQILAKIDVQNTGLTSLQFNEASSKQSSIVATMQNVDVEKQSLSDSAAFENRPQLAMPTQSKGIYQDASSVIESLQLNQAQEEPNAQCISDTLYSFPREARSDASVSREERIAVLDAPSAPLVTDALTETDGIFTDPSADNAGGLQNTSQILSKAVAADIPLSYRTQEIGHLDKKEGRKEGVTQSAPVQAEPACASMSVQDVSLVTDRTTPAVFPTIALRPMESASVDSNHATEESFVFNRSAASVHMQIRNTEPAQTNTKPNSLESASPQEGYFDYLGLQAIGSQRDLSSQARTVSSPETFFDPLSLRDGYRAESRIQVGSDENLNMSAVLSDAQPISVTRLIQDVTSSDAPVDTAAIQAAEPLLRSAAIRVSSGLGERVSARLKPEPKSKLTYGAEYASYQVAASPSPSTPTTSIASAVPTLSSDGKGNAFDYLDRFDIGANATYKGSASSHHVEAGFKDPELGWIGVRAENGSVGLHASVMPDSELASRVLSTHMSGMAQYLFEQHSSVSSLTLLNSSGGDMQGSADGGQSSRQQQRGDMPEPQKSGVVRYTIPVVSHAPPSPLLYGPYEEGRISVMA